MLKKTITFTDFNGQTVTEDHFFHISKADLIDIRMSEGGKLEERIQAMIEAEDGESLVREFKKILKMAYGKKSPDGKRFLKSEELWNDFISSEAYSELLMELLSDEDGTARFIQGIIPQNLDADLSKVKIPEGVAAENGSEPTPDHPRILTKEDTVMMDSEDLQRGLSTGQYVIKNDLPG